MFYCRGRKDNERFESMIRFCSCTQRSAFIPKPPEDLEGFDSCKICGGKLSTGEQGVLMNTIGPELTVIIDPFLNWKTSSKGRQRAVRRPRTSFAGVMGEKLANKSSKESENIISKGPRWNGGSKRKSTAMSSKQREHLIDNVPSSSGSNKKKPTPEKLKEAQNLIDKEPKRAGDMSVSESEKFGVSILGQRFCDTLEFGPLKKRRVQLVCSSLPLAQSPSHLDISHNRTDFDQGKFTADGNKNPKEISKELCEVPDFSGISLLAAAACDSIITDDFLDAEVSVPKEHSSGGEGMSMSAESRSLKEEQLYSTPGDSDVKAETVSPLDNVQSTVSRGHSSSSNNRLHWDLNTVMELWESPIDETVNTNSPAADIIVEYGISDEKMLSVELVQDQVGIGNAKHAPELVDGSLSGKVSNEFLISDVQFSCVPKDGLAFEGSKLQEIPIFSSDSSVAHHNEEKMCVPVSHTDDAAKVERQKEDVPVAKIDSAIDTKLLHDPSCLLGDAMGPEKGSSVNASTLGEDKAEAYPVCLGSTVETETLCPHLILNDNVSIDGTSDASESLPGVEQRITGAIPGENMYGVSIADLADGCHLTKVVTLVENNASLHTDSVISKMDQHSTFGFAEEASDVLVERNSSCQILAHADGLSDEVFDIDAVDNNACDHADNSKLDMSSCLSDSHPFTCQRSSNHDELSSGSNSADEHLLTTVYSKMKNNKCFVLADENSKATKPADPVHAGSNVSVCNSAVTMPGISDAPPIDGALSSHETCKSYLDSFANSPGEVALGDHADCGYDSHASQTGMDRAIGREKIELLSDDDSQYEDGEFRGSIINNWGEDEAEDGETECVDYGSDSRDVDIFEAASLHSDDVECKDTALSEAGYVIRDVAPLGKDAKDAVAEPFPQGQSTRDIGDAGCGKRSARKLTKYGDGMGKFERNAKYALESAGSDEAIGYTEFSKGSDDAWESFRTASLSSKSHEWGKWREARRSSRVGGCGVDPANRNPTTETLNASTVGKSLRSAVGSTPRKHLSSRIGRPESSDASYKKDEYYVKASRSEEANVPNFKFKGAENGRSFRRGRAMRSRGRGDCCVDSRSHWDHDSRDSPGYYGPSSFTHPGSNNAVTAVAAKLESNGFVIAPDGTILKACSARPMSHVPRRSVNASVQRARHSVRRRSPVERDGERGLDNLREMSPDRHINVSRFRPGRYGPGVVRMGHGGKYRASVPHHQPSYRREQSRSPSRRPLHLSHSHSRSPSRSRSCSPMWTLPRESADRGMDRRPDLRRRSPYIRCEVIQERMRSHMQERMRHHRPGFKCMVSYAPSARNRTSSPHASRRTDERNESLDRFRESESRRPCGRRPPARGFTTDHRSDPMDSRKRSNPDEYYHPMHSGRIHDSVDIDRDSRHASSRNQRKGHGDEYKISPLRAIEGEDHFGNGRGGNKSPSFNASGIQNCDEDMASHTRPL